MIDLHPPTVADYAAHDAREALKIAKANREITAEKIEAACLACWDADWFAFTEIEKHSCRQAMRRALEAARDIAYRI